MLDETLGKIHFWMLFVGFHATFLIQHWLGVVGMPRRYADYAPEDGFTWMNQVSTVGSFLLAASTLPFLWNVYVTWRKAPRVTVDDPWGFSNSLEWATSCPPPRHNFTSLPRIRSERPAFDLHHPEVAAMDFATPDQGFFDWESEHQGQREQAKERLATGTGEPEQAAQGVVGDGVRPDDTEGRRR